ncbi:14 kDa zinc-binding protein isoform X1 [Durio zibethinus]|uniref:14 kDa zinc-binding protein isoform X1 n=1 Tax=Durio zibethinus TaxID=66656 RepID=A0A6P5Z8D1_DURZI|nr:14 kDa zinc-binding protein isoform X1 [Durio zibethinus]
MISAQKSMAALISFSLLRNYATTGSIVASVRAPPGPSSYPSFINFLTANHSRRYLCRASATDDEEAAAKAAAIIADSGAPTIFDKIIAKEIPSTIVYEDDKVLAFKDIDPQAPVHVLVIPKFRDGLTQLGEAEPRHGEILGQLLYAARIVAQKEGILDGFRVVINNGPTACQSVYHLHLHVLGGRQMKWPPG